MKRRFRVFGRFELASTPQVATVTIDPETGIFSVRPLRRRRAYELPLAEIAAWVVRRTILAELADKKRAKAKRRKGRTAP